MKPTYLYSEYKLVKKKKNLKGINQTLIKRMHRDW